MNLDGRRILVTGAARGLGETLARHLAGLGAELILADILEEEGRAVAGELGATFSHGRFARCQQHSSACC